MLTFTGVHITQDFGAPTIRDIAVQSMRLFRFSGGGEVLWPIGMHMMLVADLAQDGYVHPWLEVHALLHDAAEVVVADVPRPMKTAEARALEDRVQTRIFAMLGVPEMTPELKAAVKDADFKAALAEGACGIAGRGFLETQTGYSDDVHAKAVLAEYLNRFKVADALDPDGRWPELYERRLRNALREAQHSTVSYSPENEVPTPEALASPEADR